MCVINSKLAWIQGQEHPKATHKAEKKETNAQNLNCKGSQA